MVPLTQNFKLFIKVMQAMHLNKESTYTENNVRLKTDVTGTVL